MKKILLASIIVILLIGKISAQENQKTTIKYSGIVEYSNLFSLEHFGVQPSFTNGILINNNIYVGLGLGVGFIQQEYYYYAYENNLSYRSYYYGELFYMPIFINGRYMFPQTWKSCPFVDVSIGAATYRKSSGIYSTASVGIKRKAFVISTGVHLVTDQFLHPVVSSFIKVGVQF